MNGTEAASQKTTNLVRSAFREYYFKSKSVEEPTRIAQREFGYSLFEGKGMIRHLSFATMGELVATLVREAPSDVYCSNAYYRFPTRPMQEKDWLGAFLIFDIDGKDLELPCVPSHSYLTCVQCNFAEAAIEEQKRPFSCPSCGGSKAEHISIPCAKCVDASKKELRELEHFLTADLGISPGAISKYFSGNNGFHVHVSDEEFASLDAPARADLVSYISGTGFMPESVGVRKGNGAEPCFVKFPRGGIEYGWRKKVADRLKVDGSSTLRLYNIVSNLGGYTTFRSELEKISRNMGVRIDAQVTSDVHRIFRMPGTLNSKSGLAKTLCTDLDAFEAFTDSCVLGDNRVAVRLKCPVKFKLRGKTYNVSKESAELPAYAGVYLACKGLAEAA